MTPSINLVCCPKLPEPFNLLDEIKKNGGVSGDNPLWVKTRDGRILVVVGDISGVYSHNVSPIITLGQSGALSLYTTQGKYNPGVESGMDLVALADKKGWE